jgi:hypothetical protein
MARIVVYAYRYKRLPPKKKLMWFCSSPRSVAAEEHT